MENDKYKIHPIEREGELWYSIAERIQEKERNFFGKVVETYTVWKPIPNFEGYSGEFYYDIHGYKHEMVRPVQFRSRADALKYIKELA